MFRFCLQKEQQVIYHAKLLKVVVIYPARRKLIPKVHRE